MEVGVPGRLDGKVAIVTGAGSIGPGWGNGKSTAVLFAREGARVACLDVNPSAAAETRAIIARDGGDAGALTRDDSRAAQREAMVTAPVRALAGPHILHHN